MIIPVLRSAFPSMGGIHRCASADGVQSIDLVHSEEEFAELGSTTPLRFDEIGRTNIEIKKSYCEHIWDGSPAGACSQDTNRGQVFQYVLSVPQHKEFIAHQCRAAPKNTFWDHNGARVYLVAKKKTDGSSSNISLARGWSRLALALVHCSLRARQRATPMPVPLSSMTVVAANPPVR